MEQERDAAERVKRKVPILVVIGNPPYNAFAGTSPEEEQGLVDVYKEGLHKKWGIKKFNLDELYVRFMRLAQRRITEGTKQGVVCFVSSFSYLADPSFVVMRERLLNDFDDIWVDCLNGDSRETGKKTPTGEPDPSVFSTRYNTAGIRLGTTIGLFTRKQGHKPAKSVRYRDFWGKSKRADLFSSLKLPASNNPYMSATPTDKNRFSFRPHSVSKSFQEWPKIIDLCAIAPIPGLQEMRFGALMSLDKEILEKEISHYLDPSRTWAEVVTADTGPTSNAGRFEAMESRETVLKKETFVPENVRRYSLYPFDNRWAYWSSVRPMWNEPRPALVAQSFPGNQFFISRMSAERPNEGIPATVTAALPDYHLLRPNVAAIPFVVETPGQGLFPAERNANLSTAAFDYLKAIKTKPGLSDMAMGRLVWLHALAICYSSQYLDEHRDGILGDWPRIPMPASLSLLEASSKVGATLSDLLNPDVALAGVTDGAVDVAVLKFGVLSRVDEKPLKPHDLAVTAGWGHRTKKGIVMPGSGRIKERDHYTEGELAALTENQLQLLGPPIDIMLNDVASLRTIPANVWRFRIGGYQVIKKWLSYREESVLGRSLTKDEAREITYMVRRISAIVLMTSKLNANYVAARDKAFAWSHAAKADA